MRIVVMKQAIMLCRQAGITPFCWGHRGVGKSSIYRQLTLENKLGFVDMRCSQLEASDIRGLPKDNEDRTIYLPPYDMPSAVMTFDEYLARLEAAPAAERYKLEVQLQPRLKEGILFLDELNRAQDDVLQATFQLVLDRRIGQYVLPPGWSVGAAGNFMEGAYQVNGFTDAAFLNRFCHLTLSDGETTLNEWVNYMADQHAENAAQIVEFASQNIKHLDGDIKADLGFSIQPSRRSWEAVIRVEQAFRSGTWMDEAKTEVIAGLVGREISIAYEKYDCPVKPRDIIEKGVKALETKLNDLNRNQAQGLMWGLVSFIKPYLNDDKKAETALDFAEWVCRKSKDKDLVVAFCNALLSGKTGQSDAIKTAAISNPNVAKLIGTTSKGAKKEKNLIDRLLERPELQKVLSSTSWGQ